MQRFFAAPEQIDEVNHRIVITGADVNHIKNVLRMRPGDELWISDGDKKEYHCRIEHAADDIVLTILYAQEPAYELPNHIWLFQGLPKGDKRELIIQKAVELGACGIVPVETKRCVMKLDPKRADKKIARWQQIAEGAAKQSRRMLIPEIRPLMSWKEAVREAADLDVILMPYELAEGIEATREILHGIKPGQSIGIFIGPEGGFTEEEVAEAREAGARVITLGRRILRTETAGMAILSVLMFQLETGE